MIKSVLQSISGVEMYPIISLLLFFGVFVIMLVRVIRMDSGEAKSQSLLPLDDDTPDPTVTDFEGK